MRTAIGIDIGGGTLRAARVAADGRIVAARQAPTPPGGAPEPLLALIDQLVGTLGAAPGDDHVVGACLPGIRSADDVLLRALNLPALEGANIRTLLGERLGRRVRVATDVNAAGFAQWREIADSPARFVYLALGTGIGGAVILDGRLVAHTRGGPGHLGHLIVDSHSDAPPCRCGARGCLEAIVGGWALPAARPGSGAPRALAVGLLQIAHLYAPECIAVGGGVIEHHPPLLAAALAEFERLRGALVPAELGIRAAPLKSDDAGVIGAALLALETEPREA